MFFLGLEHDSIVKVHECLGPDGTSLETVGCDLPAVYIIQELLDTDLHCLIQSGQLTEQHTQLFMYQVTNIVFQLQVLEELSKILQ